MCEHCLHLQATRIEKKLDLLLNIEGYEIDDYGLPKPSQELLDEQKEEEIEEEEPGAKIIKKKVVDDD